MCTHAHRMPAYSPLERGVPLRDTPSPCEATGHKMETVLDLLSKSAFFGCGPCHVYLYSPMPIVLNTRPQMLLSMPMQACILGVHFSYTQSYPMQAGSRANTRGHASVPRTNADCSSEGRDTPPTTLSCPILYICHLTVPSPFYWTPV
jgi:hypothetical protein